MNGLPNKLTDSEFDGIRKLLMGCLPLKEELSSTKESSDLLTTHE